MTDGESSIPVEHACESHDLRCPAAYIHAAVIFVRFRFPTLSYMRDEPLTYTFTEGKSDGTKVLKLVGPLTISTMFGFQDVFGQTTPQVMIVNMREQTK